MALNTLRPRQNGRHFADDIFKCIFWNENVWIPIKNSLKFVPKSPINNISAQIQIMAWRRTGDKPWSEPMMVSLLTHICVTRLQWVKFTQNHVITWEQSNKMFMIIKVLSHNVDVWFIVLSFANNIQLFIQKLCTNSQFITFLSRTV